MNGEILVAASTTAKLEPNVAALAACGVGAERVRGVVPDPDLDGDEVRRLAAGAAGVVLCGGPDIDPAYFGEEVLPGGRLTVHPERDRLDWALLEGAREGRVPVWGICRGLQVINVFFGGTLWQDVPSQLAGSLYHDLTFPRDALVHTVAAPAPRTRTGDILGRETAFVNSRHHQAVRRLADGLVAAGFAPDGLVEAFELGPGAGGAGSADAADGWWVRAVQWHPENLVPMAQQRALWEEFVVAAAGRVSGHAPARDAGQPQRAARR